ncbi:hypothetical protein G6F43_014022 [Rhizopus delemar]|nr:hypothetical protein G6F43_014022 [Rhizopus delemar]
MLVCWMFIILIVKWSLFWFTPNTLLICSLPLPKPRSNQSKASILCILICYVIPTRLVRALKHIRESVRPAVARSFFVKDWITLDQYKEVIPTVIRAARAAESTQDATMEDIHNTFSTTELDPLDVGESTSSQ